MLQLENKTPFASGMSLFPNEEGVDTLYIMIKASFNIGQEWTLADEQADLVEADVYWGEPEDSSLKNASDYHVGKPNTDIIMTGHACTQDKKTVTRHDVTLQVGKVKKSVTVFGDREWSNGQITQPSPFQTMPLVYERSFGGSVEKDHEIVSSEIRNPIGCGYAGDRNSSEMDGVALPNFEDPRDLISHFLDTPQPAGFGFIGAGWKPRISFAGTYDENWQKNRAPFLPQDFDKQFFNMAHPDLIYPGYLQGGEPVTIKGMHPAGDLNFNLPVVGLNVKLQVQDEVITVPVDIETLILEPNQLQLSMVWRGAYACDKKALKISQISIALKR